MNPRLEERQAMVSAQLKRRGIFDKRILEAMLAVQRHLFVPKECQSLAYADRPLPIGEEQTISQPYIVAYMLQMVRPQGDEKALEIGTGSGYATALLSLLTREVYSVEIRPELARKARAALESLKSGNVFFRTGDGLLGWMEEAPFDFVFVSCCLKEVPNTLLDQMKGRGKLIAPVASGKTQKLLLIEKEGDKIKAVDLGEVSFVPALGDGKAKC